jgi:signal peptidase
LIKKIWSVVTTAAVVVMVLMAALLAGARLFGLQVYTVLSGSMEPNYHVGAIIYVKEVDPSELKVGDAITFMLSKETVATHRIIEVIPDEKDPSVIRFRTKGDNNAIEDSAPVHCKNVLGKVVGTIPYLGYVSDFVQHPPGSYITMAAAAVMIVAVFLPDLIKSSKGDEEEESSAGETSDENEKLKAEIESLKNK